MGYTTDFQGSFTLSKPATPEQIEYINKFSGTRRMMRDSEALQEMHEGKFGLDGKYGIDGEFFVGGEGFAGQESDDSVLDHNSPPSTQPGLWCQWVLNEEGTELEWDQGEKFYEYTAWLKYMIANFFEPWGIKLNGAVRWQGEDMDDRGVLEVQDNAVREISLE